MIRWEDQPEQPIAYQEARTQKVFCQHPAIEGEWVDRMRARTPDARKQKLTGVISEETAFTQEHHVDAKSLRLLTYDQELAQEIRSNASLSGLISDALHVLDESIPIGKRSVLVLGVFSAVDVL